ncbi:MAG: Cell division protein FtsW [Brockia lithotrophica]|uniref:Cell division protein FtsW n=1 Tax=Brockia lithotrophica TaxID=933949 RepID=A0A2T5G8E3_9BACL|nr:putative lipid II flippase FtsW [Brockia lithotrophica]PTQ52461.1 MAG: Cell division protein FtsW [Brockia lithotrophica]
MGAAGTATVLRRGTAGENPVDLVLLGAALALVVFGLLAVTSAGSAVGARDFGDPWYYGKRQAIFAALGLGAMAVFARTDYRVFRRYVPALTGIALLALVLVLVPGIGDVRGGARSWIGFGAFSVQPAEFAKFALIWTYAHLLDRHPDLVRNGSKAALAFGFLALVFALILLEPDLGTGTVLAASVLALFYVAGLSHRVLAVLGALGVVLFGLLILAEPYRMRRITAFLDPWQDPLGAGYQTIQSLMAVGPGGVFGVGFGMSRQKFLYLPEPYNDFIFAIVAEELGFLGATALLTLFFVYLWRGVRAALRAPDAFGFYLATGFTSLVFVQVFINVGVVLGLLPVTGITLPFLSAGGSSLGITLAGTGVLLSVSRAARGN